MKDSKKIEPTMVYKKGATTVKVYGELDVKRFTEGLYKLYIKYKSNT